jgi:uncharacterized protein with HEPN domain
MRREELYVADLVDNARVVQEYLAGVSRDRWDQDRVLRDAVLYRLLLLGEIASALPDDMRERYPDVAWRPPSGGYRSVAVKVRHVWAGTLSTAPVRSVVSRTRTSRPPSPISTQALPESPL